VKGWIKIFPRVLADSEKVNKLHPAQRYWYIMLIGAAYNEVLPGLLVDDIGRPLSYRSLAHDFRTKHQQVESVIARCLEVGLLRRVKLGETDVTAIRRYADFQAPKDKRGIDLDEKTALLWRVYYTNAATFAPKSSTCPAESHPPESIQEIAELLDFMGYTWLKVIHPKEENNEKQDKQEAREDRGQRIEAGGFEAQRGEDAGRGETPPSAKPPEPSSQEGNGGKPKDPEQLKREFEATMTPKELEESRKSRRGK